MSTVYLSIGLPGSGKSTYAKQFALNNEHVVIINRDAYRSMIKGGDYTFNFRYEPFIKNATNAAIQSALEYGLDVIVDETHVKQSRRKEIIDVVRNFESNYGLVTKEYGQTKIVGWWFTENERNLEFRMKEARGYETEKWTQVIEGMKDIFEEPTKEEGYDELIKLNPLK